MLLVVLTIAVPSLLLTALAAVAVQNEEAAAHMRLKHQLEPAVKELAGHFNALMDRIASAADVSLPKLAEWALRDEDVGAPDLAASPFGPYAVNPFVIDAEGELLLPPRIDGREDPAAPMPRALRDAQAFELSHEGGGSEACEQYPRADIGVDALASGGCAAKLARLLCEQRGAPGSDWMARWGAACREGAAVELAERAWGLRQLAGNRTSNPAAFLDEAERLVALLSKPSRSLSAWTQELVARDAVGRLRGLTGERAERMSNVLLSISERGPLLAKLLQMNHPKDAAASPSSLGVDGWNRVLVTRSSGGTVMGFELVATSVASPLVQKASGMILPVPARPALWPIHPPAGWAPFEGSKHDELALVLLNKSGLAWGLAIVNDEVPGALLSLHSSRSRLYAWALVVLVVSLISGIAYTVRSVIVDARQSRLKVDFVSSVSHDLRTPLTSIRLFTETLLMGRVKSREEERECLGVIAQETERLSRLTQRIIDFSRMEAGRKAYEPRPERLSEVVGESLAACRPLTEGGGFKVEVELAPDADAGVVDRDALVEVLINLITNAVKYSPDERFLRIASRRVGDCVELSVADRGIGIPRAEQGRIFEKFYRVDCRRTTEVGGCGIGLSLVQHIVRAHRGEVRVESEPGQGSTFTVTLPAPAAPTQEAAAEPASQGAARWRAS